MGCLQVSAAICSFLSFILLLASLVSDYWVESSNHTGLWKVCKSTLCQSYGIKVLDYIHATRAFMLLGTFAGATSFFGLCASFFQPSAGSISTIKIAAIASFAAGFCALLAMSIFTGVYADLYIPVTHASFGWSFVLGWVSGPLFLATGGLAYKEHTGTTLKATSAAVV
ncbi:lens fiber membrane intrinsic protein-like [Heteronotia binoei]|uniref:lens fiber membrane intrinsic protein-like n=1 Tax=Heteronotia binoei TaxID=13085 RepID=UPI002930248F|nr:lens fiber membrane intrinsic protein-like [Heteronotia binoei]